MSTLALGLAPVTAAAAVIALAWTWSPRWRALTAARPVVAAAAPTRPVRPPPAAVVGRRLRGVARRRPDPGLDRRVGRVAVVAAACVLVEPLVAVVWVVGAVVADVMRRRGRRRAAVHRLVEELPEVVDLLTLAVSSGSSVPRAVAVVAERGVGVVADGLGRSLQVAHRGGDLADALEVLPTTVGEEVRPLVRVLAGALRDGTEVVSPLERLAVEVRLQRRRSAEERARRLPVQLLFPLVVCVLPAFALLTVVPLLAGTLQGLPG